MFLFFIFVIILVNCFPRIYLFDGCSEALRYLYNKGRANINGELVSDN